MELQPKLTSTLAYPVPKISHSGCKLSINLHTILIVEKMGHTQAVKYLEQYGMHPLSFIMESQVILTTIV